MCWIYIIAAKYGTEKVVPSFSALLIFQCAGYNKHSARGVYHLQNVEKYMCICMLYSKMR